MFGTDGKWWERRVRKQWGEVVRAWAWNDEGDEVGQVVEKGFLGRTAQGSLEVAPPPAWRLKPGCKTQIEFRDI